MDRATLLLLSIVASHSRTTTILLSALLTATRHCVPFMGEHGLWQSDLQKFGKQVVGLYKSDCFKTSPMHKSYADFFAMTFTSLIT
jgi:hypothetical protein